MQIMRHLVDNVFCVNLSLNCVKKFNLFFNPYIIIICYFKVDLMQKLFHSSPMYSVHEKITLGLILFVVGFSTLV